MASLELNDFSLDTHKMNAIDENKGNLIEIWTRAILGERPKPQQTSSSPHPRPYTIVFGRTTHVEDCNFDPNVSSCFCRSGSDIGLSDRIINVQLKTMSSVQREKCPVRKIESKLHGRQMMNRRHDLFKAREKRSRQMKYALEVKHSMKNSVTLQISSITRVVVQNFRKLIDCERCALFLMDHSTNELYFKPVGDEHDVDPKEIRFPSTTGVAGWVATNRKALNIKNAYRDQRFNPDIDRQTSFRTRTILCAPVLSLSENGHLYGVIQMVNKKKGDKITIQSNAKKKKSDSKHFGYESCYEVFSDEDAKILHRCSFEVSRALEPVLTSGKDTDQDSLSKHSKGPSSPHRTTSIVTKRNDRKTIFGSEKLEMMLKAESMARKKVANSTVDSSSIPVTTTSDESNGDDNLRERRRSSCGNLIQFISAQAISVKKSNESENSAQNINGRGLFGRDALLGEATTKFQFRSGGMGPQISAKGQLSNDPDFLMAASKRKRMTEYNKQRRQTIHYGA